MSSGDSGSVFKRSLPYSDSNDAFDSLGSGVFNKVEDLSDNAIGASGESFNTKTFIGTRVGSRSSSSSDNDDAPLMRKAVAVWLVENTSLTFRQIAEFCKLHIIEVQGIADNEVAVGLAGCNPVTLGQVTKEEIELCERDQSRIPKLATKAVTRTKGGKQVRKGARYTPVARRKDKPDAIYWLIKNCPEISDSQISTLVGTTRSTIETIRNKVHWNMNNIKPRDPVLLELCTQNDLDEVLLKARIASERESRLQKVSESKDV